MISRAMGIFRNINYLYIQADQNNVKTLDKEYKGNLKAILSFSS